MDKARISFIRDKIFKKIQCPGLCEKSRIFIKTSGLKKLAAILLLAVFLFNLAGYQLLFQYFIQQSDERLVQQLDNHQYTVEELIEVKVPLNVPYITSWSDYERVDGEIELNGQYYSYVLRKVSNDTLYLKCLPNDAKTKLYSDKNDYAKKTSGAPAKKSQVLPEFNYLFLHYTVSPPGDPVITLPAYQATSLLHTFLAKAWHPPQQHV